MNVSLVICSLNLNLTKKIMAPFSNLLIPRPHTQRTHLGGRLSVEAVVTRDVLVESLGGFQIVDITVCVTTLVSELLLGAGRGHPIVDGGVVADRALLPLLLLDLHDLDRLDLLDLLVSLVLAADPVLNTDGIHLGLDIVML